MAKPASITLSAALRQLGAWIWSAFYIPMMVLVCLFSSNVQRTSRGPRWVRGWGKSTTAIAGVKTCYTAAARAALSERRPRVLTFNHGSTLDVLIGASLLPDGGVLVLKEEFRKLPFLGRACVALGSIFLDRGDRERAYESLQAAALRIQNENLQVLMAPEGTRTGDASLGRFKLGAFHLAHIAKAPVLPVVMHRNKELWPKGQLAPTRGTVIVDVLDEFAIEDGSNEALREAADSLRLRYMERLEKGPEGY
jgi:putative phosphoserine phosphatase / 1-acylglycerol-3-phosphate O-acyltransferase